MKIAEIQKRIHECVYTWESKVIHNRFSWVDDELDIDEYHVIHVAWVSAWNDSARALPMNAFLREWATIENIKHVLE